MESKNAMRFLIRTTDNTNEIVKFFDILNNLVHEAKIHISKDSLFSIFATNDLVYAGYIKLDLSSPNSPKFDVTPTDKFVIGLDVNYFYNSLIKLSKGNPSFVEIGHDDDSGISRIKVGSVSTRKSVDMFIPLLDTTKWEDVDISSFIEQSGKFNSVEVGEDFKDDVDLGASVTNNLAILKIISNPAGETELVLANEDESKKIEQKTKVNLFNFNKKEVTKESFSAEHLIKILYPTCYSKARLYLADDNPVRLDYKIGNIDITVFLAPRAIENK